MAELTAAAIFSMCNLTSGHCGVLSTTTAILRPARFCWYWMFLSAVRETSNPARSASASKSPLESVSHPRSLALVTVWPARNRAMPRGVTWSKRMSINRGVCGGGGVPDRIKTAGGEFQYRVDLFPRDVELLDDFLYSGSSFEVFEDCGHGHAGTAKHPCAA